MVKEGKKKRRRIYYHAVDGLTGILLNSSQRAALDEIKKAENVSLSEIMRIAVDVLLKVYRSNGRLPVAFYKGKKRLPGRPRVYHEQVREGVENDS